MISSERGTLKPYGRRRMGAAEDGSDRSAPLVSVLTVRSGRTEPRLQQPAGSRWPSAIVRKRHLGSVAKAVDGWMLTHCTLPIARDTGPPWVGTLRPKQHAGLDAGAGIKPGHRQRLLPGNTRRCGSLNLDSKACAIRGHSVGHTTQNTILGRVPIFLLRPCGALIPGGNYGNPTQQSETPGHPAAAYRRPRRRRRGEDHTWSFGTRGHYHAARRG